MAKFYVFTSISDWRKSRAFKGKFKTAVFHDENHKKYVCHISPKMKNYENWENIINKDWGVYTGVVLKKPGVINADFSLEKQCSISEKEAKQYGAYGRFDGVDRKPAKVYDSDLFDI